MGKQLQLVNFEQAKRLQKLGFNWGVETVYATETDFHNQTTKGGIYCSRFYKNSGNDFSAPTVALALRWMRDEKNLIGIVDRNAAGYYFSISKNDSGTGIMDSFDTEDFDTYEQSESALLNEILELLETNKI